MWNRRGETVVLSFRQRYSWEDQTRRFLCLWFWPDDMTEELTNFLKFGGEGRYHFSSCAASPQKESITVFGSVKSLSTWKKHCYWGRYWEWLFGRAHTSEHTPVQVFRVWSAYFFKRVDVQFTSTPFMFCHCRALWSLILLFNWGLCHGIVHTEIVGLHADCWALIDHCAGYWFVPLSLACHCDPPFDRSLHRASTLCMISMSLSVHVLSLESFQTLFAGSQTDLLSQYCFGAVAAMFKTGNHAMMTCWASDTGTWNYCTDRELGLHRLKCVLEPCLCNMTVAGDGTHTQTGLGRYRRTQKGVSTALNAFLQPRNAHADVEAIQPLETDSVCTQ